MKRKIRKEIEKKFVGINWTKLDNELKEMGINYEFGISYSGNYYISIQNKIVADRIIGEYNGQRIAVRIPWIKQLFYIDGLCFKVADSGIVAKAFMARHTRVKQSDREDCLNVYLEKYEKETVEKIPEVIECLKTIDLFNVYNAKVGEEASKLFKELVSIKD